MSTYAKSQIVWIFGPSGAGKETIIRYLVDNSDDVLKKRLKLNLKVVESNESLKTRSFNRNIESIKEEASRLSLEEDISVLIKVQWSELEDRNIPRELKKELFQCAHRIIMLVVSPEETVRRSEGVYTLESGKKFLKKMLKYAKELEEEGFEVIWINSDNRNYDFLSWEEVKNLYGN